LKIKSVLVLLVQVTISLIVLFLLFQGIDFAQTIEVLISINISLFISAVLFFIMSSLTVGLALHATLKSCEVLIPVQSTILASYGGQLLSDLTPAKTGYFATPVLLRELRQVSMEKGLMSVMAMGAVNFFIKAIFSVFALIYFLNRIPMDPSLANALILGIGLLLIGGIGLAILVWTNYMPNLVKKLVGIPILGKLIKKFEPILEIFSKDQSLLKKSIKSSAFYIILSVFIFTVGILLLSNAVEIPQPSFIDLLFMGPLTAVFMYVPVTFAGLGLQETAYVFLLTSIGALEPNALAFALLVRVLFITTDLIGLPALIKTGTGLVSIFNNSVDKKSVS
jgi:uncharacterized membrane protein YbhN (UPF0104 family)